MLDFPRIALYGLLALIAITLVNAWQRDYGAVVIPQPITTLINPVSSVEKAAAPTLTSTTTAITSQNLIHVRTNVLTVAISPDGNIVDANLPQYSKSLQNKSPYTLFTPSTDNFYVAQSGFKTDQVRPIIFHSDQTNYQLGADQQQLQVNLTGKDAQGLVITKTYTFKPNSYVIQETASLVNPTHQAVTGEFYHQLVRKNIPQQSSGFFHVQPFLGAAYSSSEQPYQKLAFKKMSQQDLNCFAFTIRLRSAKRSEANKSISSFSVVKKSPQILNTPFLSLGYE